MRRLLGGGGFFWQIALMVPATVLITGCSRGIGLALVREMAARGWHVLAGARHPAAAHALQAVAQNASPGSVDILTLDVRHDESVQAAAEEAAAKVRRLDVLVNNAGVFPENGSESLEQLPLECFEEAFGVNVVGVARVTRMFLPLLTRAAHPRVINMSSLAGSIGEKEDSRYYCYSAVQGRPQHAHTGHGGGIASARCHRGGCHSGLGEDRAGRAECEDQCGGVGAQSGCDHRSCFAP